MGYGLAYFNKLGGLWCFSGLGSCGVSVVWVVWFLSMDWVAEYFSGLGSCGVSDVWVVWVLSMEWVTWVVSVDYS